MLSDEACKELAGMFIDFGCQLPDALVPRVQKIRLRAAHSLTIAGIRAGRDEIEKFLEIFHYWLEAHSIASKNPDIELSQENDTH